MDDVITEEWLRQQLHNASERFADMADIIAGDPSYDPANFLRASAERYSIAAAARTHEERRKMERAALTPSPTGR